MTVALATAANLPAMDQDEPELQAALARCGVDASAVVWDEPCDWSRYEAVIVRSTWDYVGRRDAYLAWADEVERATLLLNSAEVLRWNTHKGYLIELEERGAPIVPTAWIGAGDRVDLAALAARRGWRDVVLKPAVGAGASGMTRVTGDLRAGQAALDALADVGDAMVQPVVEGVATRGELSVICIDGRCSHAVRKIAPPGDLRVQIEFGGTYEAVEPDGATRRLAEHLVTLTGHDLLYARVDLLPDDDGSWMLGELEAAEPALYLQWADGAADHLAAAIVARLASRSG